MLPRGFRNAVYNNMAKYKFHVNANESISESMFVRTCVSERPDNGCVCTVYVCSVGVM